MFDWFRRRRSRKLWLSMLKFFDKHSDDMTSEELAYFALTMNNLKKMSER